MTVHQPPLSQHPDLDQLRTLCRPDDPWLDRRIVELHATKLLELLEFIDELETSRDIRG